MEGGKLGKYEIRGVLGRGAMGTVYDAFDPAIDRRVAIKTLPLPDPSDEEATAQLGRFRREAQAAGRLSHPNIVGVFDYGETADVAYIVMEFVDGTTLKQSLQSQERLPNAEAVRVMADILAGLRYSHERGVVHRDIKPGNIILTRDGHAKIADFGIARIESSNMTQVGTVMGTPAYMSPEQFMGQAVDSRTDIYSAGAVLYQLLTGERPFEGSMTAIMHKALQTEPPRPSELSVTAPPALDPVVAKAMAKRPDARYPTAEAFAIALRAAWADGAAHNVPATDPDATVVETPADKPTAMPASPLSGAADARTDGKRGRTPLLAAGALVLLILAGAGAYFGGVFAPPSPPKPTPALPAAPLPPPEPTLAPPVATPPPPAPIDQAAQDKAAADAKLAATPPPVSQPTLRAAIAAAIAPLGCEAIGGDVDAQGNVTISGLLGSGNEMQLRNAVTAAAPNAASTWRITAVSSVYCPVLDAVRALTPGFGASSGAFQLELRDGERGLVIDKDYIVPRITAPDFPSYLTLDYFSSDGKLFHLQYKDPAAPAPVAPQATVTIGDPKLPASANNFPPQYKAGWMAGEPAGTDLILALASEKPLFTQPRSADEPSADYIRDLRAALVAAGRSGERVEARLLPVVIDAR